MANLIRNEQLKLIANISNGVAVGFVTVGILTPAAALVYKTGNPGGDLSATSLFVICTSVALVLHLAGLGALEFLKDADD